MVMYSPAISPAALIGRRRCRACSASVPRLFAYASMQVSEARRQISLSAGMCIDSNAVVPDNPGSASVADHRARITNVCAWNVANDHPMPAASMRGREIPAGLPVTRDSDFIGPATLRSHACPSGIASWVVQDRLGHSNIGMTLNRSSRALARGQ